MPGRVNLIGDHIDYAGLDVLPAAIDRGVTLQVRPSRDGRVRVLGGPDVPELRDFAIAETIAPWPQGDWGNYVKAALQGLVDAGREPTGFDALVTSDLPAAAGLSSSSAIVVGAALAALAGREGDIPRLELAALLADAEQYVGARGGGMDQAAILAGRAGYALRVSFTPLAVEPVPVPAEWRFVVAHRLVRAEKSSGARLAYNARREAVETALGDVAPAGADYPGLLASRSTEALLADAADRLDRAIFPRFRHVVTEAARVHAAVDALRRADARRFGALMLASHDSLRDDYDVSSPALDDLVAAAVSGGAHGARLTGAGLGGCVVALAGADRTEALLSHLRSTFYEPRGVPGDGRHLFEVRPSDGATVRSC